jgi:hypothetical protein
VGRVIIKFPLECVMYDATVRDKTIITVTNEYFSKQDLDTVQNVPVTNIKYSDLIPDPWPGSMLIDSVLASDMVNTIPKLKSTFIFGHGHKITKMNDIQCNYSNHICVI